MYNVAIVHKLHANLLQNIQSIYNKSGYSVGKLIDGNLLFLLFVLLQTCEKCSDILSNIGSTMNLMLPSGSYVRVHSRAHLRPQKDMLSLVTLVTNLHSTPEKIFGRKYWYISCVYLVRFCVSSVDIRHWCFPLS